MVYRKGQFVEILWRDVRVGDILRTLNEAYFPADIIILNTGEVNGTCLIESKNLDGETNLK